MNRYRICSLRGRDPINPTGVRTASNGMFVQRLEIGEGYSNTITSVGKDNMVFIEYEQGKGI